MRGIILFFGLLNKGGLVNYIIIAIYLFTLYMVIDRIVFFVRSRYKRAEFKEILKKLEKASLSGEKIENIKDILGASYNNTCFKSISNLFMENKDKEFRVLEDIIDRRLDYEIKKMRKGLIFLSRTSAVTPLLGLLGTVTGLMASFHTISSLGGSVDITLLSGGIWEAMITTATGLATAIFAFFFYELFNWLTRKRIEDMTNLISVLENIKERNTKEDSNKNEKK